MATHDSIPLSLKKVLSTKPWSSVALLSAALAAYLGSWCIDGTADSLGLLLRVAAVAALVGAGLVALPKEWARAAVSILVLIHFGGILTAVTSVPPPGGQGSWLANQLWFRFYRPYLQFMYLNNAYHFYSPEPGPATLMWAHIRYSDGSSKWCDFPSRSDDLRDPLALEYYRRVAMNESINQLSPTPTIPPETLRRRILAGQADGMPSPDEIGMQLPGAPQYRPPLDMSRQLLQSYARFIARNNPHPAPEVRVRGVKVYRTIHALMQPGDFAEGRDPLDPTLFFPYYQGEFDTEGDLKDSNDPYLYWLLPIVRVQKGANSEIRDCLELHSGSSRHREVQE